MALEFLGAAGAGAADALQAWLNERIREQHLQQQLAQAQERIGLERAGLNQRAMEADATDKYRKAALESQDTARRDRANREGVEDMYRQHELMQPKKVNLTRIKTAGPDGKPIEKGVTDEELQAGVPAYQEPKTPPQGPQGSMQWVVGPDGKKAYRVPREGDEPFDSKATSQPSNAPSQYTLEHSRDVVRKVDDILPRVGVTTAGPIGSILSNFGGTEAADVDADLQSLAANLAFEQLQKMREASKTGGALGNVAAQELDLLKNVEASIRQNQSPANLRKNLKTIRDSAARYLATAEQSGNLEPMKPMTAHGDSGAPGAPRKPIPGIPGAEAEFRNGKWVRVK